MSKKFAGGYWESTTLRVLGMVEFMFGLLLLAPAVIAFFCGEDYRIFLLPVVPLLVLGAVQYHCFRIAKHFRAVNGLLLVGLVWAVMFLISMVPYLLTGMGLVDSFFESVSGVTTTGLSVMKNIEAHDTSLLVWRAMTMWVGGIMIVLAFMYMLPMFGIGRSLFDNELSGSGSSDYSVRMQNAAKSFIIIYAILSLINFVLLLICGLHPLQAFCLMSTTISTGGLMTTDDSLVSMSNAVQLVTITFMFLGGTNFYLHYRAIFRREKKVYRSNSEFRTIALWFLAISVIIYALLTLEGQHYLTMSLEDHARTFKNALFTTVSLGTTTGLYVEDFTTYPYQCQVLLLIVALIGASSGSTSGGIKFGRVRIIYEFLKNGFGKVVHPNAVYAVKIDGKSLDDSSVISAMTVFMMFVITMTVSSVLFMIIGYDMVDSFALSISSVSNGGMGFGNFGPTGNYADMSDWTKIVLIVLMWIGRLEIVTALVMLTPGFWKELLSDRRLRKRAHSRSRKA